MDALFHESVELAVRGGNDVVRARLMAAYGAFTYLTRGQLDDALAHLREAVELADATDDVGTRLLARFHLVQISTGGGHFDEARTVAAATLPLCGDWDFGSDLVGYSPRFGLLYYRTMADAYAGDLVRAATGADTIFTFGPTRDEPFFRAAAAVATTPVVRLSGDIETAVRRSADGIEVADELEMPGVQILSRLELGRTLLQAARFGEAETTFTRMRELIDASGVGRVLRISADAGLARCAAAGGDANSADANSRHAADAAVTAGHLLGIEASLARAAALAMVPGDQTAAAAALDRAASLVRASGGRALEPSVLDARAHLADLRGDTDERDRHLEAATRLCHTLGAPRRIDQLGLWQGD